MSKSGAQVPTPPAGRPRILRGVAALASVLGFLAIACAALWWQDWRYTLRTPRPAGLRDVPLGAAPDLPDALRLALAAGPTRPALLHFFNPECPCSRFNLDHVRDLVAGHAPRVRVVAVLEGVAPTDAAAVAGRLSLGDGVVALADPDGAIADALGVYSTPQGAVLHAAGHLRFRGNYNSSRYCTSPDAEYVRIALDAVLAGAAVPDFPPDATTPYGCELPSSERDATPTSTRTAAASPERQATP